MHVLLFDIGGTLIRSGGAGKAAMAHALRPNSACATSSTTGLHVKVTFVALGGHLLLFEMSNEIRSATALSARGCAFSQIRCSKCAGVSGVLSQAAREPGVRGQEQATRSYFFQKIVN